MNLRKEKKGGDDVAMPKEQHDKYRKAWDDTVRANERRYQAMRQSGLGQVSFEGHLNAQRVSNRERDMQAYRDERDGVDKGFHVPAPDGVTMPDGVHFTGEEVEKMGRDKRHVCKSHAKFTTGCDDCLLRQIDKTKEEEWKKVANDVEAKMWEALANKEKKPERSSRPKSVCKIQNGASEEYYGADGELVKKRWWKFW